MAKPILNAFTKKAVESIGNASPEMMAAGMHRFHKGSRSRTHHGELDFTTKKSSKVHHIDGHFVRDGELPRNGPEATFSRAVFRCLAKYKKERGVCCCSTRCWAVFLLFIFYIFVIILD